MSHWFKGKEIAFAFGVSYMADFVEYVNAEEQSRYLRNFATEPVKAVSYGLFTGFAICCVSVLAGIGIVCLESRANKIDKKKSTVGQDDKFKWSDVKLLGFPLWIMSFTVFFVYCVVYPYISNVCNAMLVIKYGYTEDEAATVVFLPYLMSPFLCPPLGILIDKVGKRVQFSKYRVILMSFQACSESPA